MKDLTDKQLQVLAFLADCISEGLPPTVVEIAKAFEWESQTASICHLVALEKKGYIVRRRFVSRGIYLTPAGIDLANRLVLGS